MPALSRLISRHAGQTTALVHDGRIWSYRELASTADALADAMDADQLTGERVALMLPTSPELVATYLGCFAAGAVAGPLNRRYAPPEIETALRRRHRAAHIEDHAG